MRERYLEEAGRFEKLEADEERRLLFLSLMRLAVFLSGIVLTWFAFTGSIPAGLAAGAVSAGLFLWLLRSYGFHTEKKAFFHNLSVINRNEAAAVTGDQSPFEDGMEYSDPHHLFSADIDIFGKKSLFQYLNRTVTGYGRDILARWLSDPFILSAELNKRQEAVRELALKEGWRHAFMAWGMNKPLDKDDIRALTEWMNEDSAGRSYRLIKILVSILPPVTILLLILVSAGIISYLVLTFIILINLFVVTLGLKKNNRIHRIVTGRHNYLTSIHHLLKVFEKESFDSVIMNDISTNISGSGISAAVSAAKFGRLIQAFDSRMNLIMGPVLNGLLLWDYQCILRIEKWKRDYSGKFPVWLEMLGTADAFISLANYAFNNPAYVYPVPSPGDILFSAVSLGHPLIGAEKRVCNDFSLKHKGNVCIISGANMSGKSTFLRTVAVNYILGMAGVPVCAEEMVFTPVKLFTSMRTTDSLPENESYFYAELKRLRMLKAIIEKGDPVFFVLDEILKGTNSADKSSGSKLFMRKIIELGGTGLIATHDISLGEMESEFPGTVINKCFEIDIEGELIRFDYKLRDGITRRMNAAILMRQMGILE